MIAIRRLIPSVLGVVLLFAFSPATRARIGSLVLQAPPKTATMKNPMAGQERARHAGAKLFSRECAACHGDHRQGGVTKAPPLNQPEVYDAAPGALFWVLRNGALQLGMPSFAHLPEAQRWQIVTYLQDPAAGSPLERPRAPHGAASATSR
jgi:mono/diheme cytochrome c family protein